MTITNRFQKCVDIKRVSDECAYLSYSCVNEYQRGDLIVRRVHRAMQSFLTPYTGSGKCIESIRSLACISVFPECPVETDSFMETIPSYSKAMNDIGRKCGISIDDVSDRLLTLFESELHHRIPKQSATSISAYDQLNFEYWINAGEQTIVVDKQPDYLAGATQAIAAVGDIMIFAVFLLAIWYFGWHLVHQWSQLLQRAYFNLARSHLLTQPTNSSHSIAINVSEDKR
ncbi:hypothetical protein IWW36_000748 [Coemansia brasiliensis]|uniref:Uncharacterized protein n=1 Tax=Coemansia brasiliensis TaxID=2650707 RepID=A0A9W8ID90_9FUNG|nr:hypothetical protein IWW36_000748 [Coemansia brasiliensis]